MDICVIHVQKHEVINLTFDFFNTCVHVCWLDKIAILLGKLRLERNWSVDLYFEKIQ